MAISRSLIPQQISKGGKMPKVGEKHFKYTKEGREKAKKHAKKTGQEIEYMGGGVVNRKYYAMGGKIQVMRKKRKEKKAHKPGPLAARRAALAGAAAIKAGMYVGSATPGTLREYRRAGQDPRRAGPASGKWRKIMQDWDSRKPVPRKKKLYTTLQKQSQAQKRKKAKRRTAGTKHMGKPRLGVAGLMKYFKQLPEGKRKFGKGGVIKKGVAWLKAQRNMKSRGKSGPMKSRGKSGPMKSRGDYMKTSPKPGSREWWGTPEGAKAAEKMQPKIPKPKKGKK